MLKQHPDYKIINLDALTYCGNLENLNDIKDNPNYKFVHGNICDKKLVPELVEQVDAIVNFAAESHVDNSIKHPEIFVETNVQGTLNLLQSAKEFKIEKYLQVSTDEVYGTLGKSGYFTETTPLAPNSPYSASKAGADMLVRAYHETYGLPTLNTRCSNNYGPYQYPEKLIPYFITLLQKGEKVPVYGDGQNVRDWLYVEDHCKAIDLIIHNGRVGEVYNVGGHNEMRDIDIVNLICEEQEKRDLRDLQLSILSDALNEMADSLGNKRSRDAIKCSLEDMTLKEMGDLYGRSCERFRQAKVSAIRHFRRMEGTKELLTLLLEL